MSQMRDRIAGLSPRELAALSQRLKRRQADPRRGAEKPVVAAAGPDRDFPLSFAQERLWFIDQLDPGGSAYNVSLAMVVRGRLDEGALESAWNEVIRRHGVLRTVFPAVDGRPVQKILAPRRRRLPRVALDGLPEPRREPEMRRWVRRQAGVGFDLARGPLLHSALVTLSPGERVVVFTLHHIVSDGWSMRILIDEMKLLYRACHRGEPSPLPELPVQYADYALWQRQHLDCGGLEEQRAFWRRELGDAPRLLELPTDRPRPPTEDQAAGAAVHRSLSAEHRDALGDLARLEGTTLFCAAAAAFLVLLHQRTGCRDLVIGTNTANRNRLEIEGLIGFFVNQVALRVDLSGQPTLRQIVNRVREAASRAFANQDLPFEKIVEDLRPERDLAYAPLVQVKIEVVVREKQGDEVEDSSLEITPLEVDLEPAHCDLYLHLVETVSGLEASLYYRTDLFDRSTVAGMLADFAEVVTRAGDPETPLQDLADVLRQREKERLSALEETLRGASRHRLRRVRRRAIQQ